MLPTITKNATHSYGPPENWDIDTMGSCGVLSVRVQKGQGGVTESVSTWKPSLEEISLLQEGGSVILTISAKQPAVSLHVEIEREEVVLDEGPYGPSEEARAFTRREHMVESEMPDFGGAANIGGKRD